MAKFAITAPSLILNGNLVPYIANSISITMGDGEVVVDTQSFGGLQSEVVTSQNVSSLISKLKFKVKNTAENLNLLKDLKSSTGEILVQLSDQNGFAGTMRNGSLINDPDFMLSATGETDVEIHGSSMRF